MIQIANIFIQNYRRLRNTDINLYPPLNVMIGATGVGKTSFLEVLSLLSASASGRLQQQITSSGGINNLLTYSNADKTRVGEDLTLTVALSLCNEFINANIDYVLRLEEFNGSYKINCELLYSAWEKEAQFIMRTPERVHYLMQNNHAPPQRKFDPLETALSQTPETLAEIEVIRKYFASAVLYTPIDIGPRSPVRLPQPIRSASTPGKNGEELISYLYMLREDHPERFYAIEDTLSAAFPDFERLDFSFVAVGLLTMTWKDKSFEKPMTMNQLAGGTLRFLWLVSLLQSPALPALMMIEEPEVSLHPDLFSLLAQLLREATERSQIFVETHSARLIRFLKPYEVLVLDGEDGYTKMTRANEVKIGAFADILRTI